MEHLGRNTNVWGMYRAQVVDIDDPLRRGRVKFKIIGLIEPRSAWARREATDVTWELPQVGQYCTVYFENGEVDFPIYLPGTTLTRRGVLPNFIADIEPKDTAQMRGLQTEKWEVLVDDRLADASVLVRDRSNPENYIVVDGVNNTVSISGMVGVNIQSIGAVNISAMVVTINGRTVLQTGDPI